MKALDERDEFLKAYEAYADAIFRHCYFRLYDRERAKELMQETFMRTWTYMTNGNVIRDLRPFLYRTANNVIIDEQRKRKPVSLDELTDAGVQFPSPQGASIELRIDAHRIMDLVKQIDEPYRTAVTMRYIDELSPKEIAMILETSENVISVRIHRGVEKVRKLVEQ